MKGRDEEREMRAERGGRGGGSRAGGDDDERT